MAGTGKDKGQVRDQPPAPYQPQPSREDRIVAWAQANQKPLLIGVGSVAAIVLVTWFMSAASARKENFARIQLERAWNAEDGGNAPLAAGELQGVIQSYGGTTAALEARLSLNQNRLLNGQSQLAADDLREFLGSNPPGRFAAQGHLLLAGALENLGQPAEAAAAYETAAERSEFDYQKAEALLSAARAHRQAGNTEKARAALQVILDNYPESAAYPAAEIRMGELIKG